MSVYYYITCDSVVLGEARGAAHSAPSLTWSPLADAIEAGEVNSFSLLRWDSRLVETLYGRAEAQEKILSWARVSRNAALARLIQGEGGAGKTRLAAEVAKALRNEGWTAGFLPRNTTEFYFPANPKGVLLIVDYPEEQPERTKALLDRLADLAETTHPLRVLFLSRRPYDQWIEQATHLGGRFGGQAIAAPQPLTVDEAEALIAEAAHRFRAVAGPARVKGLSLAVFDPSRVRSWLAQDDKHRLPLYAAAAAVQAVLDPAKAFGQTGAEVLTSLVLREFDRVRPVSEAIGLGKEGLITLLALGVLADGLTQDQIGDLIGLGVGAAVKADYFERLADSPWWHQGRLIHLEPDALAAAFLNRALFPAKFPQGRKELPDWLYAALLSGDGALAGRLERVLFDLLRIAPREGGGNALEDALVACVKRKPQRAKVFEACCGVEALWCARFAAEVARQLAKEATDITENARRLTELSLHLAALGERAQALAAGEEAVKVYRHLVAARPELFLPYLAMSLSNLSNRLGALGQREAALAAIEEAVAILEGLAQARPDTFLPNLASSLNNLSIRLDALGQLEAALMASEKAVTFYRVLAQARPDAFMPKLAGALNNLSTFLDALGQPEAALVAIEEAVALRRELTHARPDAFMPKLAGSLNNLCTCLDAVGQHEAGLAAIEEAVTLYRALVQARPEAFMSYLAGSLNNLSSSLDALGQQDVALAAIEEAVTLYRALAQARPDSFLPDLAGALHNLCLRRDALGQREAALAASEEAVSLYRALAQVRPAVFREALQNALYGLRTVLDALGRTEEAAAAAAAAAGLGD